MNPKVELYEDQLRVLNQKLPLSEKIQFVHQIIKNRLEEVDRIAVVLYDSKTDLLKTFIFSSDEAHPLVRYQAKLADVKSLKEIVESGRARVVSDLSIFKEGKAEHTQKIAAEGYGSSYTQPIFLNGQFLGFVFFNSYRKHAFQQEILPEINFFGHLISSMVSTELATIRMMLSTVQAAKQISALHHLETGRHIDRVSHYARLIAQELAPKYGFNDEYIENIFLFSPLHDIGKVGVSAELLKKSQSLTEEEAAGLKNHVIIGRQIIDSIIRDFGLDTLQHMTMLQNIAEFHHEAMDGSGYARGLRGEDIPIEARIISVADIFDALTSPRSYKVSWSNDEAFALLRSLAGYKLDQDCVRALARNQKRVIEIQEGFKESSDKNTVGNRKHYRLEMELEGDIRNLAPGRELDQFPVKIKTIGRGGLMFVGRSPVSAGTPLQVRVFHHPDVITFNTRVVWMEQFKEKEESFFRVGCQYDPPAQGSLLQVDFFLQDQYRNRLDRPDRNNIQ